MARYVYMVVSIATGLPEGVTNIPNLGLHKNKKKATQHFLSCIDSRVRCGEPIIWTHNQPRIDIPADRCTIIRESYIKRKDCRENLRLERWKVE